MDACLQPISLYRSLYPSYSGNLHTSKPHRVMPFSSFPLSRGGSLPSTNPAVQIQIQIQTTNQNHQQGVFDFWGVQSIPFGVGRVVEERGALSQWFGFAQKAAPSEPRACYTRLSLTAGGGGGEKTRKNGLSFLTREPWRLLKGNQTILLEQ